MSYAELKDVKARAGRLRGAWDDSTDPGDAEIEVFLQNASDELDAAIASRGFATPITDTIAAKALLPVVADKALLLALRATWPGGSGPEQARELIADVSKRVDAYDAAIVSGNLAAILYLGSTTAAQQEEGAADFWTTEGAEYEYWVRLTSVWPRFWTTDPWGLPASAQPQFTRNTRF